MKPSLKLGLCFLGLATSLWGEIRTTGGAITVAGKNYEARFSLTNGSLMDLRQTGKTASLWNTTADGLWRVKYQDGGELRAADFATAGGSNQFSYQTDPAANTLLLNYKNPDLGVQIKVSVLDEALEFSGEVKAGSRVVLDFYLPGKMRFEAAQVERLVFPNNGNFAVGSAFKRGFFEPQSGDHPAGWTHQSVGGKGYVDLFGAGPVMRPMDDPAISLKVTPAGAEWLGKDLARQVAASPAFVIRPPAKGQASLVLVDSANGPYLSKSQLGGKGGLWRVGGFVKEKEAPLVAKIVQAVAAKLGSTELASGRRKVAVISLHNGPERGGGNHFAIRDWQDLFEGLRPVVENRCELVEIKNPAELLRALAVNDFSVILNPYGEGLPVEDENKMSVTIAAIGKYVRAGGNWIEVGGYSFFVAMKPVKHFKYELTYPPAFADFIHLDSTVGSAAMLSVQPQKWPAWAGATNRDAIFVPGHLGCGSDALGGYAERAFVTYVSNGTWRVPTVRLAVGKSASDNLRAYCELNLINKRLDEKMSADVLKKFKESVLVFYTGNCAEKLAHLDKLPVPSLVHFSDYLKGGFDKEYPDHLPPNARFGSAQEMRKFYDRCHQLGHLVMPYTNPTWWCDHPRGPTFEREGDAPLLRLLNGKLSHEKYGDPGNDGWTICHWHPAVQKVNREVVRQFSEDFPVDILFQDQCGARGWRYDLNPASPAPHAYVDGLISMVNEDSRRKPLSTEAGWDKVVNYQAQLCGLSFQIVPTEGGPAWRRFMKYEYPPALWDIFPLAQYIAHDKTAMLYHDLGQFVTTQEVLSWTLGLGFNMSYRNSAPAFEKDAPREWLNWLDRIQKSVCARYTGEPVKAFTHERGAQPKLEDDGLMCATYGSVDIIANLDARPVAVGEQSLPAFGFYCQAPGMIAARLKRVGNWEFGDEGISFLVEQSGANCDVWVYSPAAQRVAVKLLQPIAGKASLKFDRSSAVVPAQGQGKVLEFQLPNRSGETRIEPPATLRSQGRSQWPGPKPAIGIIDLGKGVNPSWTTITPAQWHEAFGNSKLAREYQLLIKRLTTLPEIIAALQSPTTNWLAIINPYGEGFPAEAGKWKEMLARIQNFVNNGGSWWEVGGHSFHHALVPAQGGWKTETVGPQGLATFGLPIGSGEVDAPAERLTVSAQGKQWLGDNLSGKIAGLSSVVNRSLPTSRTAPPHLALVKGNKSTFIGGYRLSGWGYLWRMGGFGPNPEVALPTAVAATEYQYTHASVPIPASGTSYLWHGTLVNKP